MIKKLRLFLCKIYVLCCFKESKLKKKLFLLGSLLLGRQLGTSKLIRSKLISWRWKWEGFKLMFLTIYQLGVIISPWLIDNLDMILKEWQICLSALSLDLIIKISRYKSNLQYIPLKVMEIKWILSGLSSLWWLLFLTKENLCLIFLG
jgi:hypothetical protein